MCIFVYTGLSCANFHLLQAFKLEKLKRRLDEDDLLLGRAPYRLFELIDKRCVVQQE